MSQEKFIFSKQYIVEVMQSNQDWLKNNANAQLLSDKNLKIVQAIQLYATLIEANNFFDYGQDAKSIDVHYLVSLMDLTRMWGLFQFEPGEAFDFFDLLKEHREDPIIKTIYNDGVESTADEITPFLKIYDDKNLIIEINERLDELFSGIWT
jgi:hypothetical protein